MLTLDCSKHGDVYEQATCNRCTAEIVRELEQAQAENEGLKFLLLKGLPYIKTASRNDAGEVYSTCTPELYEDMKAALGKGE